MSCDLTGFFAINEHNCYEWIANHSKYTINFSETFVEQQILLYIWTNYISEYNATSYEKMYGYYSMWNVNNINQRNIESTQKLTEYA